MAISQHAPSIKPDAVEETLPVGLEKIVHLLGDRRRGRPVVEELLSNGNHIHVSIGTHTQQ
jgi:hypothetical protein